MEYQKLMNCLICNSKDKVIFQDDYKLEIKADAEVFKDVKLYDWKKTEHSNYDDHSQAYFPHMDKDNGLLVSLNVESQKK